MDLYEYSVVNFLSDHRGGRCGYCGATDTNYSRGMWAYRLTIHDYELLIDRGLRRSGKYVYKPSMDITCCPCYSVKCAALDFKVSKAHKKILNRVTRYLKTGTRRPSKPKEEESEEAAEPGEPSCSRMDDDDDDDDEKNDKDVAVKEEVDPEKDSQASGNTDVEMTEDTEEGEATEKQQGEEGEEPMSNDAADSRPTKKQARVPRPGEGRDPTKPPSKKAKQLRREKKLAKLAAAKQASGNTDMNEETMEEETKQEPTKQEKPKPEKTKPEKPKAEDMSEGSSVDPSPPPHPAPPPSQPGKTLQDYIKEHTSPGPNAMHKLEVILVRSQPRRFEFNSTFDESYALYKKYQMAIHKDKPSQCSVAQYTRFLVESPLQEETKYPFPKHGFGSFHQHYRIDGKLVAVAVLDILPHSVSSVYFYYDPDYHFLSLGNYSALREIAFTQDLHKIWNKMEHYYMGFYIHNCVKMRYKGHFHPSYLLCPMAYTWQPIKKCYAKLEISPYSRLDETDKEDEPINVKKVLIFFEKMIMAYEVYQMASEMGEYHTEDVKNYANTIGKQCSQKLLLLLR